MNAIVDLIGFLLGIAFIFSALFYAPFASNGNKALRTVFITGMAYAALRIIASLFFAGEDDVPILVLLILPFVWVPIAIVLRALKSILFSIPLLARWEAQAFAWVRLKFVKSKEETNNETKED